MRLWLLRHAKSSWDDADLPDLERPLSPRGERAAERIGRYVEQEGIRPELVLCSAAARARATLDRVLPSLGEPEVRIEPELYTFDPEPLIERIRALPPEVASAMLVGHNPATQALALWLAGSGERLAAVATKFPTAALAELELDVDAWSATEAGRGVLTRFVTPRELG